MVSKWPRAAGIAREGLARRWDNLDQENGNGRASLQSSSECLRCVLSCCRFPFFLSFDARNTLNTNPCMNILYLSQSGPYREGLLRLRSQMAELAGPAVLVQPELVLVVGPVLTLAGFPPLQVAASEILHLGPSRGLNRARVDAALAKFLRTEQRFGS
ncbi:hypothetical protein Vafri_2420 [Volvox africanus]|nr:hypothetical protein Vafri_2420 [Volvox africanus]